MLSGRITWRFRACSLLFDESVEKIVAGERLQLRSELALRQSGLIAVALDNVRVGQRVGEHLLDVINFEILEFCAR